MNTSQKSTLTISVLLILPLYYNASNAAEKMVALYNATQKSEPAQPECSFGRLLLPSTLPGFSAWPTSSFGDVLHDQRRTAFQNQVTQERNALKEQVTVVDTENSLNISIKDVPEGNYTVEQQSITADLGKLKIIVSVQNTRGLLTIIHRLTAHESSEESKSSSSMSFASFSKESKTIPAVNIFSAKRSYDPDKQLFTLTLPKTDAPVCKTE